MIRHTVVFKLKHPKGSEEERQFLIAAQKLSSIPRVNNFECLRQVSDKNDFDFGLSMQFDNEQHYNEYSSHPDHVSFVTNRWLKEVQNFLEIDYQPLEKMD